MLHRSGRKSAAQTPAPKADQIKGSSLNAEGSASSGLSASDIKLSDSTVDVLKKKYAEFREKYPRKKNITLNDLKAVYRRGSGAYSKSHRPTISGGKPNSRAAWSYARVNKFLKKAAGEPVKKAYVQDDDLMKFKEGGSVDIHWYRKYKGDKPFLFDENAKNKYGAGIYFHSAKNSRFEGENEIEVKVNYNNPKVFESTKSIPNLNFIKSLNGKTVNEYAKSLFEEGYDAILVKHSNDIGDELILIDSSIVEIVNRYEEGAIMYSEMIALPDTYSTYENLKPILENQGYTLNKNKGEQNMEQIVESLLEAVYPLVKEIFNKNGLIINESYAFTDGSNKSYLPYFSYKRTDEKIDEVKILYFEQEFEVAGELNIETKDDKIEIEVEFPRWNIDSEVEFAEGGEVGEFEKGGQVKFKKGDYYYYKNQHMDDAIKLKLTDMQEWSSGEIEQLQFKKDDGSKLTFKKNDFKYITTSDVQIDGYSFEKKFNSFVYDTIGESPKQFIGIIKSIDNKEIDGVSSVTFTEEVKDGRQRKFIATTPLKLKGKEFSYKGVVLKIKDIKHIGENIQPSDYNEYIDNTYSITYSIEYEEEQFAKGGQISIGQKFGDWAITQYKPIVYEEIGGTRDGIVKLVNQDTLNEILIQYDGSLRGAKWFARQNGVRIEGKTPIEVIEKLSNLFSTSTEQEIQQIEKAIIDTYGAEKEDGIFSTTIEEVLSYQKYRTLTFNGLFIHTNQGNQLEEIITALEKRGWRIYRRYDKGGEVAERFGLKNAENLSMVTDNVSYILSQYASRKMAAIQVHQYLSEIELGSQWLSENNIKNRVELVSYLGKMQSKARSGKGLERTESLKQMQEEKSEMAVKEIIDMAYKSAADDGQITCVNCDWSWNTEDSEEWDKYDCHQCGFDNTLFYDNEIIKPTLSVEEIAEKHDVSLEYVRQQLEIGANHEMEHTTWYSLAQKIALHHLAEDIEYYQKLKAVHLKEGGSINVTEMENNNEFIEEFEIPAYLMQQRAEADDVLHCSDSRIFKTMICKTKIEVANRRMQNTNDPEEKNVWNECALIWSDCLTSIVENNIPIREYKDGGQPCGCSKLYRKGGLAYGNSHDNNGIPLEVKSTGQKIEIEGGEGVVNKISMQSNEKVEFEGKELTPCEVVSKINEMGGGVKFKCADVKEIIENDGKFD